MGEAHCLFIEETNGKWRFEKMSFFFFTNKTFMMVLGDPLFEWQDSVNVTHEKECKNLEYQK